MKKRIFSAFLAISLALTLIAGVSAVEVPPTFPTPAGFNDNDYQKLVAFALQYDNLDKLGWDLESPESLYGVTWNNETEKRVTKIELYGSELEVSLEGSLDLSDFTALTSLLITKGFISDYLISELNLSNCTALTSLLISSRLISEIDLTDNTSLISLNISGESISELDLSKNTALTTLAIGGSSISELDLSENTALTALFVGNDPFITNLDLSQNIALKTLEINGTGDEGVILKEINISNNTALERLVINYICLEKIDVTNNTALKGLSISSNKVKEIDVSNNIALEWLHVNDNLLTEIDTSNNILLHELFIQNNLISEIDLSKNIALEWLNAGLTAITDIDLSNNLLLKFLWFSWSGLTDISAFDNLENLQSAQVLYNFLDLECSDVLTSIEAIQETVDKNGGHFWYETQGRTIDRNTLIDFKDGKVSVNIVLANGRIIEIDPARITSEARETDLNIDIQITSQGNQVSGVPANSIVIRPFDHGEFGFEISFVLSAEELEEAGLNGNSARLWHIDDDGKVVEDGRVTRNNDGSVTIGITRASYYVMSEDEPAGGNNQGEDDCDNCGKFPCECENKPEPCKDCEKDPCECEKAHDCAALGHKFGAWKTTVTATTAREGSRERICEVCEHKETETIARLTGGGNTGGGGSGGGGGGGSSTTDTPTTPTIAVTTGTATWAVTSIPRTALTALGLSTNIPVNQLRVPTGATGNTTVSVGASFAGQNAVLVKFNAETQQLEFVSASTVSANGNASINITQTGDFLVLTFKTGDITGTGEVQTADALAVLRDVAGISKLNSIQTFVANGGKGDIGTNNALDILRLVAGIIDKI
ncbi:MAG: hypothetical protein LBC86_01900 [Oscillospiraceae bacterium]|nr:hypothetical protein [Oscillospiraceae bacterium]